MGEKLIKVTLEWEKTIQIVEGGECRKWLKMVDGCMSMAQIHGMVCPDIKWQNTEKVPEKTVADEIVLMDNYWDCECRKNFIHHKLEKKCFRCGAERGEQPGSRENEWREEFSSILKRVYGIYQGCLVDKRNSGKLDYEKDPRVALAINICEEVIRDGLRLHALQMVDHREGETVAKGNCFSAWLSGNIEGVENDRET